MLTALKHNPDLFDNDMLESLCNTSTVLWVELLKKQNPTYLAISSKNKN